MESHPFTIASADGGDGVECVVKQAGDWTRALHALALSHEKGVSVRCTVEGPYGESVSPLEVETRAEESTRRTDQLHLPRVLLRPPLCRRIRRLVSPSSYRIWSAC